MFIRIAILIAVASHLSAVITDSVLRDPYLASSCKYGSVQQEKIALVERKQEEIIRIVSYNILFNIHEERTDPLYRWERRFPRVVEAILHMDPDIVNVQEMYPAQFADLMPYLEEKFAVYIPVKDGGELNGIFYRKDRFTPLEAASYEIASSGRGISDRLVTVCLQDTKTGKVFSVFNTHLEFCSPDIRERQCRQILMHKTEHPVILTGDMNTFPNRRDLQGLPFHDGDFVCEMFESGGFFDAKDKAVLGHLGPLSTFTNNPPSKEPFEGTGTPGVLLDHIFVSDGIEVLLHAVEPCKSDGFFPSDHLPVLAECVIE